MASTESAPAAAHDTDSDAEAKLAQFTERLATAAMSITGRLTTITVFTSLTAIGALQRLWWVPPVPAIAGACLLEMAIAVGRPLLRRRGSTEPAWAQAARRRGEPLGSRDLPAENLEVISRCLAGLPQPAFACISQCSSTESAHMGTCQLAGVLRRNRSWLMVIGEHLAAGPPDVLAAVLAHESGHTARWQVQLRSLAQSAGSSGWLIIGWAVPWPALVLAAAGLLAALTALSWLSEITCDARAARHAGMASLLEYLNRMSGTLAAARADRPRWQRYLRRVLNWLTVPHPPFWLRRAMLRRLPAAKGS